MEDGLLAPLGDDEDFDLLLAWWKSYGPGTPQGDRAGQHAAEATKAAWQRAEAQLLQAGIWPYELEASWDAKTYTVQRAAGRVPVEKAYPELAEEIARVLKRFTDISKARAAR